MAWCGARVRLEWGVRWKQQLRRLFFPLRCTNGLHRCCIWPFSSLSVRHSLAEVWFCVIRRLALCAMLQPLNQAHSLCRRYFVHVAGQLGHTLLKTCTLYGKESRIFPFKVKQKNKLKQKQRKEVSSINVLSPVLSYTLFPSLVWFAVRTKACW